MKIAIVNFLDLDNLKYSIDCLDRIDEEIIDARVDFYTNKNYINELKEYKLIKNSYPLYMDKIPILFIREKLKQIKDYALSNKYDIAVDTQGSFKSAFITYLLSGRTAGFVKNSFLSKIIAFLFYDEKVKIKENESIEEATKRLLSEPFGFLNKK